MEQNMTIGFVGLGLMGTPMARRIMASGRTVLVWNRTRTKAEPLLQEGAQWVASVEEMGRTASVIISMLSTPDVVEGIAAQVRTALPSGGTHIDCSTISPDLTKKLWALAKDAGRRFIHAPVLGSVPQATDGSLLLFAGGEADDIDRVAPLLSTLGKKVYRFATVDQATNTKLLANFFIASMMGTLSQGFVFAQRAGIDPLQFLEILGQSTLTAPVYQFKGPTMLAGEFTPRFPLEHMRKDVELAAASAMAMGIRLPYVPVLQEVYKRAVDMGLSGNDYSVVFRAFQDLSQPA